MLSPFPELRLPQHFISTSLGAQSSSYLGLDSCSRLEKIIILTAGARMPLRGTCLCPGKYFHELLGVDRGETPRAGSAAGETRAGANCCVGTLKGVGVWVRGEEEPGEGSERGGGRCCGEAGVLEDQDISCSAFVLFCLENSSVEKLFTDHTMHH